MSTFFKNIRQIIFRLLSSIDMKLYLIFVVISAGLWFVMKLTDRYNKEIPVNLHFINYPQGLVPLSSPPSVVQVFVSAKGFKLLGVNNQKGEDVTIDAGKMKVIKTGDGLFFAVMPSFRIKKAIEQKLKIDISGKLTPDSFGFILDRYDSAVVAVKINADFHFISGFKHYGPLHISPEKVVALGPARLVDTLSFVTNKHLVINNLSSDFKKEVTLLPPDPRITIKPRKAAFTMKVVEYIEAETEVPIRIESSIPGLRIKTFPQKVTVKYSIPMPDYQHITDSLFRVAVTPDSLSILRHNKLIVKLLKTPPEVENARLSVHKVDFIILKK